MAGYSKRRLVDKLGIKAGHRAAIINAPDAYDDTLGALPEDVSMAAALRGTFDFIQFFTTGRGDLERRFATLKRRMKKDGMLWVSWPKRASGVSTDVTEDVVREIALAGGLVDVKVCVVDETWSGLKLVYRLTDR
jgi:hypothetical protein